MGQCPSPCGCSRSNHYQEDRCPCCCDPLSSCYQRRSHWTHPECPYCCPCCRCWICPCWICPWCLCQCPCCFPLLSGPNHLLLKTGCVQKQLLDRNVLLIGRHIQCLDGFLTVYNDSLDYIYMIHSCYKSSSYYSILYF